MPNVNPERVIGVRVPLLRKYAKGLMKDSEACESFLAPLPHKYYEEDLLHAFIINEEKNEEKLFLLLEMFLPYVDNWATCDGISPKLLKKRPQELDERVRTWILSDHEYTVRFAIGVLMKYYLGDAFNCEYADLVAKVRREEYYIKMMVAWYFATALAKNWESVIPYIKEEKLARWEHNMTIKKACESFRITEEQKKYLKSLKK